ncbi:MAG: hypothetical protein AB7S38_21125 [Vulcanimicrobiota bacterium]
MKITPYANTAIRPNLASQAAPQPPNEPVDQVDTPKDNQSEAADFARFATGGLVGLGLGIAALYAGTLGGAALGAAVGGGFGPVVASVASHGTLGFIGTTFATAGVMTKVGIVAGGITGLVGAFDIGRRIGHGISDTIKMASGKADPHDLRRQAKPLSGKTQVLASGITGVGAVAGGLGGFFGGAAIGGISGLATGSGMGAAAGIGGLAGGLAFAVMGGWGGYQVAKGITHAGGAAAKVAGKAVGPLLGTRYKRVETLEQEETKQAQRTKQIEREAWTLERREIDAKNAFDSAMGGINGELDEARGKLDKLADEVEGKAQVKFQAAHPDLATQRQDLTAREERLTTQTAQLDTEQAALDATLNSRAEIRTREQKKAIEADFAAKNAALDPREATIAEQEAAMKKEARQQAAPELARKSADLRRELVTAREDETRAVGFRDAVEKVGQSTAQRRADAEAEFKKAEADHDYWQRVLEQVKKGEEA